MITKDEIYRAGGNTPQYFDYDPDDFGPKQIGDKSANLAIRATSDEDVLSTGVNNYIEVKFENPVAGTGITNINKDSRGKPILYLYLPAFLHQYIIEGDFNCGGSQVVDPKEKKFLSHMASDSFVRCAATRNPKSALGANGFFTWSLKLNVNKSLVIGDKLTFNVIAYADYYYENSELLTVEVKGTSETITNTVSQAGVTTLHGVSGTSQSGSAAKFPSIDETVGDSDATAEDKIGDKIVTLP